MDASGKTRIAILGGGAGALSTAFELTSAADWRDRYEITVYQMGWRLGGKGASSRNSDHRDRIEEHGLHVLGGFYHNAMSMLWRCYKEWAWIAPAHAIAFDDAFQPNNLVHLAQLDDGGWRFVRVPFPANNRPLGREPVELSPLQIIRALIGWIRRETTPATEVVNGQLIVRRVSDAFVAQLAEVEALLPQRDPVVISDEEQKVLVVRLDTLVQMVREEHRRNAVAMRGSAAAIGPAEIGIDYLMLFWLGLVCIRGMIWDAVWISGFDRINKYELLRWLGRHGGRKSLLDSVYVRSGYDYVFAYLDGDIARPNLAAGVALRGFLRLLFTYNKAVFVHMNGGMGEVVFTPLYEVLASRGVRFNFFHRVDRVSLDALGNVVDAISGVVQAQPRDPKTPLDPLAWAGRRHVWPQHPKYEDTTLAQADQPKQFAEDLFESPWQEPSGSVPFTLQEGKDFDIAVLGIAAGALPSICGDLVKKLPRWSQMLAAQETIPTASVQIWHNRTTGELGWNHGPTIMTTYGEPLATWADMSYLLPLETAPGLASQLSYYCGPMPHRSFEGSPTVFRTEERRRVNDTWEKWRKDFSASVLPNATFAGPMPPRTLVDVYHRSNNLPSDRYVLSPAGSINKRMRPDESGVANLFLVGDWTRNGHDSGAFETAVLSGRQCARGIAGASGRIPGESDFP